MLINFSFLNAKYITFFFFIIWRLTLNTKAFVYIERDERDKIYPRKKVEKSNKLWWLESVRIIIYSQPDPTPFLDSSWQRRRDSLEDRNKKSLLIKISLSWSLKNNSAASEFFWSESWGKTWMAGFSDDPSLRCSIMMKNVGENVCCLLFPRRMRIVWIKKFQGSSIPFPLLCHGLKSLAAQKIGATAPSSVVTVRRLFFQHL